MPRGPRLDAPGALHHVTIRGLERREIFRDDQDRWDLLDRLGRLVPEWAGLCFAWLFMGNHFHLVLQTRALPLAWLMRRLNTGFALRFNQRHERVGYLFQNRFKSRVVAESEDLRVLLRYVHLNPLRAGMVDDLAQLERYRWSSYPALLGHRAPFEFESVDRALALFGDDPEQARRTLRSWMGAEAFGEGAPSNAAAHPQGAAPGIAFGEGGCLSGTGSVMREIAMGSLDELVDRVTRHFGVAPGDLTRGGRCAPTSRARAVIAFIAVARWRMPAKRVAAALGVSTQAVCQALERGARLAAEEALADPRVRKLIS
jgi:REP element-mobilizing transposase RayT